MFKAIFWDNDGVLVDTEPVFLDSTREVLADVGIILDEDYYVKNQLAKNLSAFDLARAQGISEEKIIEMRNLRNEIYANKLEENVPVLEGVKETLEKIYDHFNMGVVTSSHKNHFDLIMKGSGLRNYFDFFITNEDVKHTKPNPEPYLMALRKSGLAKEECLVIEDTERGLTAAKVAGLSCYAIPTDLSAGNDFSKADMVLGSVSELPGIILG
ncbi:HAD family hydrolase [Patescibacteria group bacterium]